MEGDVVVGGHTAEAALAVGAGRAQGVQTPELAPVMDVVRQVVLQPAPDPAPALASGRTVWRAGGGGGLDGDGPAAGGGNAVRLPAPCCTPCWQCCLACQWQSGARTWHPLAGVTFSKLPNICNQRCFLSEIYALFPIAQIQMMCQSMCWYQQCTALHCTALPRNPKAQLQCLVVQWSVAFSVGQLGSD